jgi:hypothetical protein
VISIVSPLNVQVNGDVHGFDRTSRQKLWTTRIENQALDPSQPAGLPILVFLMQTSQRTQTGPVPVHQSNITCLDKRTGRIVYAERLTQEGQHHFDVTADVDQHQVDLRLGRSTVRLTFTDKPWPE